MKTKTQIANSVIAVVDAKAEEWLREAAKDDNVKNAWSVGYMSAMFGDIALMLQKANPEAFKEYCEKWGL